MKSVTTLKQFTMVLFKPICCYDVEPCSCLEQGCTQPTTPEHVISGARSRLKGRPTRKITRNISVNDDDFMNEQSCNSLQSEKSSDGNNIKVRAANRVS